MTATKDN